MQLEKKEKLSQAALKRKKSDNGKHYQVRLA